MPPSQASEERCEPDAHMIRTSVQHKAPVYLCLDEDSCSSHSIHVKPPRKVLVHIFRHVFRISKDPPRRLRPNVLTTTDLQIQSISNFMTSTSVTWIHHIKGWLQSFTQCSSSTRQEIAQTLRILMHRTSLSRRCIPIRNISLCIIVREIQQASLEFGFRINK